MSPRIEFCLNQDQGFISTSQDGLDALTAKWKEQGRSVTVYAHEDEKPGFSYGVPRFRVIVNPAPKRPIEEIVSAYGIELL